MGFSKSPGGVIYMNITPPRGFAKEALLPKAGGDGLVCRVGLVVITTLNPSVRKVLIPNGKIKLYQ